jgi:hypothetical protein
MNSAELPIQAIIKSRLRSVRPRGQLPKYGADSALSSLVKRQITGSSDFGTSDNSSVPLPVHATQSLPSRFFPFWHEGWAQFPMAEMKARRAPQSLNGIPLAMRARPERIITPIWNMLTGL